MDIVVRTWWSGHGDLYLKQLSLRRQFFDNYSKLKPGGGWGRSEGGLAHDWPSWWWKLLHVLIFSLYPSLSNSIMNLHCSAFTAITNNNNVSNSRIWERYKQWIVFWSNYDLPELDLNSNQPWKGKCSRCRVNIWISLKIQMNQVYLCLGIAKFARIVYF